MKEQVNIDQLFQKAKTQPVARSFEKTKNEFLKHLPTGGNTTPTGGKGSFFTLKNVIIMISSILTISAAAILLIPTEVNKKPTKEAIEKTSTTEELQEIEFLIEEAEVRKSKAFVWPVLETQSLQPIQSFRPREITSPIVLREINREKKTPTKNDYKYYPRLTAEEISNNHRQKKKMIKALVKLDKKVYAYIPAGSFDYKGTVISTQSFLMQVNEVTNLEYRTFLFDLLIQGRKSEFDIAKPEQENWTQLLGADLKSMEEQYFSHEAFNDYPVCNVTRAGVEMYCVWLTKAVNATIEIKINDLRIPTRIEWYKAASNEGKQLPFPWDTDFTTNETDCYLANYSPKPRTPDMTEENALAQDGAMFTAKTATYNPNGHGLYNLSGNVAEMVYEDYNSKNRPGTAGGSWLNSEEEIKINGPDPYEGVTSGHPGIGFRLVTTYITHRRD